MFERIIFQMKLCSWRRIRWKMAEYKKCRWLCPHRSRISAAWSTHHFVLQVQSTCLTDAFPIFIRRPKKTWSRDDMTCALQKRPMKKCLSSSLIRTRLHEKTLPAYVSETLVFSHSCSTICLLNILWTKPWSHILVNMRR